jgi:hypothetical protein
LRLLTLLALVLLALLSLLILLPLLILLSLLNIPALLTLLTLLALVLLLALLSLLSLRASVGIFSSSYKPTTIQGLLCRRLLGRGLLGLHLRLRLSLGPLTIVISPIKSIPSVIT